MSFRDMSFREKSAWISIGLNALVYGVYFAAVLSTPASERADPRNFVGILFGCVVALVVLAAVMHVAAAVAAPRDARATSDERERFVRLKAANVGFSVLTTATVATLGALLLGSSTFVIANALLSALVLSEIAKAAAEIAYFRSTL